MSFGYGVSDAILLVQLAWNTFQGTRQACGEYDELTKEVSSMHKVLQRLHLELADPKSILHRSDNERANELHEVVASCEGILRVIDSTVKKYNTLGDNKKSGKKLWQKIKFGNGEVGDLAGLRLKLSTHTSAISMMITLCQSGSQGRMEEKLTNVGGDLEGIRSKVDWIAAKMAAQNKDGTVWTTYTNDDKVLWRQLRTELNREGYDSSVLRKHRRLIKSYVRELGKRGAFDQVDFEKDPNAGEAVNVPHFPDTEKQNSQEGLGPHMKGQCETSSSPADEVHVKEWLSEPEYHLPSITKEIDTASTKRSVKTPHDGGAIDAENVDSLRTSYHPGEERAVDHIPNSSNPRVADKTYNNSTTKQYEYTYGSKKDLFGRTSYSTGWYHHKIQDVVSFCPYRVSAVGGGEHLQDLLRKDKSS